MTPDKNTYYRSSDLVDRLSSASNSRDRDVTFLLGSAVSLPDYEGGHGVPGVSGIVELIRNEFEGTEAADELDDLLKGDPKNKYQNAFKFLHGRRGQDAANEIVRTAVWRALDGAKWPSSLPATKSSPSTADPDVCKTLEDHPDAWRLPRAVDLLGSLIVTYFDTFGRATLTTNFDPLIEVSILRHGGSHYRTVLHDDGNLGQTVSDGTHIIHLHGYWWGYDTLHTSQQLGQPRPRLKRSLGRVIEASTLVVVGYGGWDDIITQTLMELVSDSMGNPEILWAFYEDDVTKIEATNQDLLAALAPGIRRGRVLLYRGIDCVDLLSDVSRRLKQNYPSLISPVTGPRITAEVKEISSGNTGERQVRIAIDVSLPEHTSSEPDSPLFVEPWVGRDHELGILASSNTSVAFITGMGGQGKSALAGRFLKLHALAQDGGFHFWDWRDCREESHRLNTQVLRLVERLSDGAIDASRIEVADFRAIVGVLFGLLIDRRALLVFDNVDQYIDLETFELIKGLDYLVAEAQARSHQCLFLFTCRPDVQLDESRAIRLPLTGFTEDETAELLTARGVLREDQSLVRELHVATRGHPLWINLIAMQSVRGKDSLWEALELIRRGGATLPETTRKIWSTLNKQQRDILRTMAELDRPESESELVHVLPGINVNRINRALKTLRSFHLVEVRTRPEGEPLLGLHPLIREFVRSNFPKKDREKYVGAILSHLDQMISQFRALLPKAPSYQILEYWTRKADFQMSFGHFEMATSTIEEISRSLINRGYVEEMVRLTMRLFAECDWAVACSSYRHFDSVFGRCLELMIQMNHEATDDLLSRYESAIPGKSSQFILLCNLRCYFEWYHGRFESAIVWGENGERLKESSSVDTSFSCKHNLALARRDGGELEKAIESFLDGESLNSVVAPGERIEAKNAPFYGNIGRCLYFSGKLDEAMVCYIKSAQLLQQGHDHMDQLNRGYVRLWIAELFIDRNEDELAASFLRAAMCMWEKCSPPRSAHVKDKLVAIIGKRGELSEYLEEADWKVEGAFLRWLDQQ